MKFPEPWAVEWGEDEHGQFMSFAVGDVVHRMRYIPPGRFIMGSPEREVGRYDDEVQHDVELTEGFWLGETPVTQALWEAVTGLNPSEFKSPDRPVEMVSWEDCQEFCNRLRGLVDGLNPRFPTEAEWEYACRAETKTATWVGDLNLKGENNAPVLDAIAWYGGNSGHGFDLENGGDSLDWPNKQHPHTKAGTRRVRQKRANPWGLYDVLGNVWEWCSDWNGSYGRRPVIDPIDPLADSLRVVRGGSWDSVARIVRASYRSAYSAGDRFPDLGFRLARSMRWVKGTERPGGERGF